MATRIILQYLKNAPAHARLISSISPLSTGRSILQTHSHVRPNFGIARKFSAEAAENEEEDGTVQPAVRDPAKDRSQAVPVEVSMRYMKSEGTAACLFFVLHQIS